MLHVDGRVTEGLFRPDAFGLHELQRNELEYFSMLSRGVNVILVRNGSRNLCRVNV